MEILYVKNKMFTNRGAGNMAQGIKTQRQIHISTS
jgi:hypothetical protein